MASEPCLDETGQCIAPENLLAWLRVTLAGGGEISDSLSDKANPPAIAAAPASASLTEWRIGENVPWSVAWSAEREFSLQMSDDFPSLLEGVQTERQGEGAGNVPPVHLKCAKIGRKLCPGPRFTRLVQRLRAQSAIAAPGNPAA